VTAGLQLGAPGVYPAPARVDLSFRPVRLDVAGFVGVAPRGPVDEPVLVQSWSDYLFRFGGFGGPGLLPFAVSAFFEQGGERAWVVRVAPHEGAEDATARHELPGVATGATPVQFAALGEGAWGGLLRLQLEFEPRQQFTTTVAVPDGDGQGPAAELHLPAGTEVPEGSLLRIRGPGLPGVGEFRWVQRIEHRVGRTGRRRRVAVIDRSLDPGHSWGVAVITATLVVEDPDPGLPRYERITDLGLDPAHPRFLALGVAEASLLVTPVGDWAGDGVRAGERVRPTDPLLRPVTSTPANAGRDRYAQIDGTSFFDGPPGDPPDPDPLDERSHHGADRLARVDEIGLLAVPDLFWSGPAEGTVEIVDSKDEAGGATFGPCPEPPVAITFRRPAGSELLDPRNADDLAEILARQQHLVALAERYRRFVVLLDVPQRLAGRAVAQWRAEFDSSFAAAYHPWLSVNRTVVGQFGAARDQRRAVPPSAFAAGIIAARERRLGLSFGPANELAEGAVLAVDLVTDDEHDVLHQLGVNVYRAERDGFRLTAARTLARDRFLRQLTVRRLMTMLRLVLERQAQWVVFEPNTAEVRELLRNGIVLLLSELYRAGAFAGASEEEAYYVRSDDSLNPRTSVDLGRLVVEVGVAPSEPLEFLVLRISRDGDGGVRVEEDDRGR
jgi:hypothetical protein